MEKYIGTKIIEAEAMEKDSKDGYKVIYSNPNNTTYESWSPKDVFEDSYTEVSLDTQLMRKRVCDIISNVNKKENLFLPQSYLWLLLDELENNNFTFKKDL